MVDLPGETAGQLCAVEAVLVLFHGLVIFRHAPGQIQPGAENGGMVGVAQGALKAARLIYEGDSDAAKAFETAKPKVRKRRRWKKTTAE